MSSVVSRPQTWLQTATRMPSWLAPTWYHLVWCISFRYGLTIWHTVECHVYAEGYQSCHQHSQPWEHSLHPIHPRRGWGPAIQQSLSWENVLPGSVARLRTRRERPQRYRSRHTHYLAGGRLWYGVHDHVCACWEILRLLCPKSQLRNYLGKLFHLRHSCPTLRLFLNRMLKTFRAAPNHDFQAPGRAFKADVKLDHAIFTPLQRRQDDPLQPFGQPCLPSVTSRFHHGIGVKHQRTGNP